MDCGKTALDQVHKAIANALVAIRAGNQQECIKHIREARTHLRTNREVSHSLSG